MSPLHVYKASAGSGKTYALTLDYLGLLFRSPGVYRNILAVTFTNKAAGEMKHRILETLQKIAGSGSPEIPDEMSKLMEITGLEREEIRRRAARLLKEILNGYSGFSVGTIDKFFQSVIRAFTREIGIQPGYNLELDQDRVLSVGVDRLFRELAESQELQQWLIRFAEERIRESVSWNFRDDIMQLGRQLFMEAFQGLFLTEDLRVLEKGNLDLYLDDLQRVETETLGNMVSVGREALDALKEAGVEVEDFRLRSKSPPSLFLRAYRSAEVKFTESQLDALVNPDRWLNKGATAGMEQLTLQVLMPLLNRLYEEYRVINTLVLIRKHFYTMGILGDLWEQIHSYMREKNLFLITDSNRFLKGIIGGNQVPFIYERTGNRYHHLMLDEFQDTSIFQYDNFKPLLDNALAQGYDNLVVGDVKQSIYRWRNADWKILATMLESDFSHQELHVHSLVHNFRSCEQVVLFNNTLFELAASTLAGRIEEEHSGSGVSRQEAESAVQQFRSAYRDAVQQVPEKRSGGGGMVKVELLEPEEARSFEDQVLDRLPEWIREILDSGVEPGEIAILVRTRREGAEVAGMLLEHGFRLISNESLLLAQNRAVILLVTALRFLVHPRDELNLALLKYQCYLTGVIDPDQKTQLFDVSLPPESILPEGFLKQVTVLRKLPLFELVEMLIGIFGLDEQADDLPYLQAFQDQVIDLQRKEPQGITDFLHYWDQRGSLKGIPVSEASNAIRILTIHKAKGLEFKAVIVPFCNWEITTASNRSTILWCGTTGSPFDRLPVVPVRYSSKLEQTLFSGDYFRERVKGYMDSLNLMYVAFTRAVDALYIAVPLEEEDRIRHTGDLIRAILQMRATGDPTLGSLSEYRTGNTIHVGTMPSQDPAGPEGESWQITSYPVGRRDGLPKIHVRNDQYFVDEEGVFRSDQMYGNMMHRVFSGISTLRDAGPLIDSMVREGVLPVKERDNFERRVMEMLSSEEVRQWFSDDPGRTDFNERNLFTADGHLLRPDRVMVKGKRATVVDFKFGNLEHTAHISQVRNYMEHMKQLGHEEVEGFLWYVTLGKTIQIGVR